MSAKVLIVILVVLVIGVSAYEYEISPVRVKATCQVRCVNPHHQGDNLIEVKTIEIKVSRWNARAVQVLEEPGECRECLAADAEAKKVELAKAAEAERQAKINEELEKTRAETETIFSNIEANFGFENVGGPMVTEKSIQPGALCWFVLEVKNLGSKPISGVKFVVKPAKYLKINYEMINHLGWNGSPPVKEVQAAFKRLTQTGVTVNSDWMGMEKHNPVLNPDNSPYYKKALNGCGWGDPWHRSPMEGVLRSVCILDDKLTPGQDVTFTGYLILNGHEKEVGAVVCHVMNP